MAIVWNALKNREIWIPLLYLFFVALSPSISTPMFYYETNVLNFSND